MIIEILVEEYDKSDQSMQTDGCGCCSGRLNIHTDQIQIRKNAIDNIVMALRVCETMKWDATELMNQAEHCKMCEGKDPQFEDCSAFCCERREVEKANAAKNAKVKE